jgi:acetoacetyl-CoA synthetase
MTAVPDILWEPDAEARSATLIGRFLATVETKYGVRFDDYNASWRWSVEHLADFWAEVWECFDVHASKPYDTVLSDGAMPGVRWFEGARLNYAEHALRTTGGAIAIIARSQTRGRVELTWDELRAEVGAARRGLQRLGVGAGDRVAAYLPNVAEMLVAFLASASLGAVFTTCAPEFGVRAVLDRLQQVEPKVLLVVDGYRYGSKDIDRSAEVSEIRAGLPSADAVVMLQYLRPDAPLPDGTIGWDELVAEPGELIFEQVAANHPLYVLYSSGTTGLPKPIIHGHGGILLVHLKDIGLMSDIGAGDRFFWFSTTGWMMWNYLVSGLLTGATIVLFDGDLASPDLLSLWRLAAEERVTWFGASAPFITACRKAALTPGRDLDLSALRAVGSTGAPLPAEGFRWVYDAVSTKVLLSSISGGTDICAVFVGGCPIVPVWAGEIACRSLGVAVDAFDEAGHSVIGKQGELVVTKPLPSMPIGFWNDQDGSRYFAAYFDTYPGVWRHGDWITITDRGSCVISGRSDATLNRSGVRIGTSEIYRAVEQIDQVADSLMVHLEDPSGELPGELILFVALSPGAILDEQLDRTIRAVLRTNVSPRHVPDEIYELPSIPTTLSGKKLELPVKKILRGAPADAVASRGALRDPTALDAVVAIATARQQT